jgi:hypothetical protein
VPLKAVNVLVAMFAAVCLIIAAVACAEEVKPQVPGDGQETAKPGGPQRIVAAIPGAVAEAEGIRMTFLEKVDPWTAYGQFEEPPAGNIYVAVKIAMENVGKRDHDLWPSNFSLKTSSFDGEVTYFKAEPDLFAAGPFLTLSNGARAEGWVTFTVAQGAQLRLLKYDPDPLTTSDIEFHFQGDGVTATVTAQAAVPEQQEATPEPTPIVLATLTPTPPPTARLTPAASEVLLEQAKAFVEQRGYYPGEFAFTMDQQGRLLLALAAGCAFPPGLDVSQLANPGFPCSTTHFFLEGQYLGTDTFYTYEGLEDISVLGPGQFLIAYTTYGPEDPRCCPSVQGDVGYTWDGQRLNASGEPPRPFGKAFGETGAPTYLDGWRGWAKANGWSGTQ